FELPASIDVDDRDVVNKISENLADARHHSGQPGFGNGAGFAKFNHHNLVYLSVPGGLCPTAQVSPSNEAGFIVVRPEISGPRVRVIHYDHRNVFLTITAGNHGRYVRVHLILNDQVDSVPDELLGVVKRD